MTGKISNDFLVASIVRLCNKKNEPVWFNKLEKIVEGRMARNTLSKNIDKLFDYGLLNGTWEETDGSWKRTFVVSGEARLIIDEIIEKYGAIDELLREICAQTEDDA